MGNGQKLISEKKPTPELCYAFTENGVELPVLDITNPLFISSIDETALDALGKESMKQAKSLAENPLLRFFAKRSLTLGKFLPKENNATYVSGMSTLMMKLGPGLVGGGVKRFMDRKVAEGFVAMTVRMRLRDICRIQAEALIPKLRNSQGKNLCFINIGGGSASDSINSLILLQEKEPALLKERKIEINVLDLDTFGPSFAGRSIESLRELGGRFHGLDVSFRFIQYDWKDTAKLADLLSERKDWIQVCESEGGLFEYGTDEEITLNLKSLFNNTSDDAIIAGDVVLDMEKVNPAFPAMLKGSSNMIRFIGIEGLKKILERTSWKIDGIVEKNPTYIVFTLKKIKTMEFASY